MPIQRKKIGTKYWYRWGEHGTWYPTEEQALKQMRAIKASQAKRKK